MYCNIYYSYVVIEIFKTDVYLKWFNSLSEGDKSTQKEDILKAHKIAQEILG